MREIIYIQAGRISNNIGTHFWNAQQTYFTYGEDAEDPIVDHDVSFREGMDLQGGPTFCPRLLLFDRKSNFGAISDPYTAPDDEADGATRPWNGSIVEYRQPMASTTLSATQARSTTQPHDKQPATSGIRPSGGMQYWSDYSLVDYHPRSLQRLPDPPEWEDGVGDWRGGAEAFEQFNEETDLLEGPFRMFVEECDNLKGLNIVNDTTTFGSFVSSFLAKFRDDFVKLPCLTFSVLSERMPTKIDGDDVRGIKHALNDALCIQTFCDLATMTVPLQCPRKWDVREGFDDLDFDRDSIYDTSAILSTHIESVTMPLRQKRSFSDLTSLCSTLNWRNITPVAQLSGILPFAGQTPPLEQFKRIYDFSAVKQQTPSAADSSSTFSRWDVSRGFSQATIASYEEYASQFRPLPYRVHAPLISLPSSFPALVIQEPSMAAFSSLQTTSTSSLMFSAYASLAGDCLTKHVEVVDRMGLDMDEIKELRETMWSLEDKYRDDEGDVKSDDADLGEDEEF